VPPVVVTSELVAGVADADAPALSLADVAPLLLDGGAANTKADGGSPPMVSASAAFSA
jgi:hypothetical protein